MEVIVIKKRIKNIHLRVKDGKVVVSAPFLTSKARIEKIINDNMDFINKQLAKQESNKIKDEILIGSTINILGKEYTILSTHQKAKVTEHFIFLKEDEDLKKQIKRLFKDDLYIVLKDLSFKYFQIMSLQVPLPKIIIKDVKSKWGSYNKVKHEIIYSSNLLFKDARCFDYLVVHELAHILEFNHSKRFYDIIEAILPNYKQLRKILKED